MMPTAKPVRITRHTISKSRDGTRSMVIFIAEYANGSRSSKTRHLINGNAKRGTKDTIPEHQLQWDLI
jgi:hypothetical protein